MFHAEQMCPDSLCFYLGFATVCYTRIKTPHQRMMIRATSGFFPPFKMSLEHLFHFFLVTSLAALKLLWAVLCYSLELQPPLLTISYW